MDCTKREWIDGQVQVDTGGFNASIRRQDNRGIENLAPFLFLTDLGITFSLIPTLLYRTEENHPLYATTLFAYLLTTNYLILPVFAPLKAFVCTFD